MFKSHPFRVYVHDTDVAGVVHHSNYLKYFEAGRIEFLRSIDHPYIELQKKGLGLVPVHIDIRYKKPLREDDEFIISTEPKEISKVSVLIEQKVLKNETICVVANVKLVHVKEPEFKPLRIPQGLYDAFLAHEID